jgi:hypothetical protein
MHGQGYEAADAAVGFATFAGDPNLNCAAFASHSNSTEK